MLTLIQVALRKESVDRNKNTKPTEQAKTVALRKESVDRNYIIKITQNTPAAVALRKESVDRNNLMINHAKKKIKSLSARRAWIEIRQFGR